MTVNLRGWKAIAAILVVLAASFAKYQLSYRTLEDKLRETIRTELAREYLETADIEKDSPEKFTQKTEEMLKNVERIGFRSIKARGKDDDVVVRMEVLVDGKPPAGKSPVRYFRMEYSVLTGWRYLNETSAFSYYAKIF